MSTPKNLGDHLKLPKREVDDDNDYGFDFSKTAGIGNIGEYDEGDEEA